MVRIKQGNQWLKDKPNYQSTADADAKYLPKTVMSAFDAFLLTNIFLTAGTQPNLTAVIDGVTELNQLKDKRVTIRLHQAISFGANATLNVNGLGAINISNYSSPNTSFRISTLVGYVLTLVYNGTVFVMTDFGATNPVDGGIVNQTIQGAKTFNNQVDITSPLGFGITNAAGYFYGKQSTRVTDVIGDARTGVTAKGGIVIQKCIAASTTKGGGAWADVFNSDTYLKGASAVVTAVSPQTVSVAANTKVALGSTSSLILLAASTSATITDPTSVVQQVSGRLVFKEYAALIQANAFSIGLNITPTFGGSPATLIFELFSLATNTVVRSFVLTLNQSLPTGYTSLPHTLQFFPVADAASFAAGYEVRVISDKAFTYQVARIVRNTIGQ